MTMAASCGNLKHPFFKETFSAWEQLNSMKEIGDSSSSFPEIFGELRVHAPPPYETSSSSVSSSPFTQSSPSSSLSSNSTFFNDVNHQSHLVGGIIDNPKTDQKKQYSHSDSFSSMNSESLSICTEGLGIESFDDVEEDKSKDDHREFLTSNTTTTMDHNHSNLCEYSRRSRTSREDFPPPISCIGRSGKPWVFFKSYREDGRFILKEIRIPTQEFLHSCRENGRLKMHFIQSDEEDENENEDEDEETLEGKNGNSEENVEYTSNGRV